jgi:hypothetical protein
MASPLAQRELEKTDMCRTMSAAFATFASDAQRQGCLQDERNDRSREFS